MVKLRRLGIRKGILVIFIKYKVDFFIKIFEHLDNSYNITILKWKA